MDAEAKILNGWNHYWEIAEDCEKTNIIQGDSAGIGPGLG